LRASERLAGRVRSTRRDDRGEAQGGDSACETRLCDARAHTTRGPSNAKPRTPRNTVPGSISSRVKRTDQDTPSVARWSRTLEGRGRNHDRASGGQFRRAHELASDGRVVCEARGVTVAVRRREWFGLLRPAHARRILRVTVALRCGVTASKRMPGRSSPSRDRSRTPERSEGWRRSRHQHEHRSPRARSARYRATASPTCRVRSRRPASGPRPRSLSGRGSLSRARPSRGSPSRRRSPSAASRHRRHPPRSSRPAR